jgi:hypothetical protein
LIGADGSILDQRLEAVKLGVIQAREKGDFAKKLDVHRPIVLWAMLAAA